MTKKGKILLATFMAICIVMVSFSIAYNTADGLNEKDVNNQSPQPDVIMPHLYPPVIHSVYSSANPAYTNETIQFYSNVSWFKSKGTVTYFVTNSTENITLSGSTYAFQQPGNYTVKVRANYDGAGPWKSFTQSVVPFELLSVNVMNTPTTINKNATFNNSSSLNDVPSELTNITPALVYNLSNSRQNATLDIFNSLYNGSNNIISLNFSMVAATWEVSIDYILMQNGTSGPYYGLFTANVNPIGSPSIHLGDALFENYTGNVSSQILGVENGISLLASQHINSDNANIQKLGLYYSYIDSAIGVFTGMVPHNVSDLNVAHTYAIAFDFNFWKCLEYSFALTVESAGVAYLIATTSPAIIPFLIAVGAITLMTADLYYAIYYCE